MKSSCPRRRRAEARRTAGRGAAPGPADKRRAGLRGERRRGTERGEDADPGQWKQRQAAGGPGWQRRAARQAGARAGSAEAGLRRAGKAGGSEAARPGLSAALCAAAAQARSPSLASVSAGRRGAALLPAGPGPAGAAGPGRDEAGGRAQRPGSPMGSGRRRRLHSQPDTAAMFFFLLLLLFLLPMQLRRLSPDSSARPAAWPHSQHRAAERRSARPCRGGEQQRRDATRPALLPPPLSRPQSLRGRHLGFTSHWRRGVSQPAAARAAGQHLKGQRPRAGSGVGVSSTTRLGSARARRHPYSPAAPPAAPRRIALSRRGREAPGPARTWAPRVWVGGKAPLSPTPRELLLPLPVLTAP